VLDRDDAGEHLEDGDLGVEAAIDGGELDPDGAGADHHQLLGDLVEGQDLDVGEDAVVGLEPGEHAGGGTGGDDDVLGAHPLGRAVGELHVQLSRAGPGGGAAHPVDL